MYELLREQGLESLPHYLTALAIGLLIGLERERNPTAKAGLRTCALVALAGAISAALAAAFDAPALVAVGAGAVALMMIAAYYERDVEPEPDPGTTTVAAVLVCYLLGALALAGQAQLAVILAILATALLYFKAELGGAARRLERRELVSILQFAVIAFVVLPLLPEGGYGPYQVLNPHHVWLMVVLISGISLAGYVALRLVGGEHGATLLGLLGGLVSSTATTLAYSRHARREEGAFLRVSEIVIVTANLVLLVRLSVVAAVVAPGVLSVLAPVLATALAAGAGAEAVGRRSGGGASRELAMPPVGNPTELRSALGFAFLYALVLVLAAWLADLWGSKGVYAVSLASGLVDVDAIALTNLRLFGLGQLSAAQASTAVVLALAANAAFKLGIVRASGGAQLFRRCVRPIAASVAGAALGLALFT